jgi:hypothetical protein
MESFLPKSAFSLAFIALTSSLLVGPQSAAAVSEIRIVLNGDQEVPPVQTSASGNGTVTVEDDKSIKGKITTSNIKGTGAHIHEGPVGKNGPDIIPLTKTSDSEWAVPGDAKLSDAQYDAFKAGHLYVNIHSDAHKSGEIRGQLKR